MGGGVDPDRCTRDSPALCRMTSVAAPEPLRLVNVTWNVQKKPLCGAAGSVSDGGGR